jgi:chemotaxis protein histidine kinase CheA
LVHRVFRAIHTIKGSGATAGFAHLARFAHKMEEAFDLARDGRLAVTPDLIDCGLKACDVLRLIIEEKVEGPPSQERWRSPVHSPGCCRRLKSRAPGELRNQSR